MNEIARDASLLQTENYLWYLSLIKDKIPIYFYENIFNIPRMSVYSLRKLPENKRVILENYTEKTKALFKIWFYFQH